MGCYYNNNKWKKSMRKTEDFGRDGEYYPEIRFIIDNESIFYYN